ncbi:MAG TPA: MFS transporter [Patescibacteria group bacterium]
MHTSNWKKWGSLVVLSMALAIIVIDTTLLNVSLGTIIREFNTTIQGIQWVITAYALTLSALTITGGRLGDLFGRKRMFMLGAVIFAVGSYVASISHNVPTMILGESIIEGVGAALMMPATSSLLLSTFEGRERAIAFGVWGAIAAAAAALGPIIGGFLTTHYSWRWGFRINIVVAAILLLGSILVKEARDTKEKPSLDWGGVFLSSIGLLLIVFGVIEASTYGWWFAKSAFTLGSFSLPTWAGLSVTPYSIILGVILLVLFGLWERYMESKGRTPLVSLGIFQNQQFAAGSATTAVMSLSMTGMIFSLPVFLQAVRGLDAFQTGMSLLPMSLTILVVAPLSGFLSTKFRPKYMIQLGLFLNMLGVLVLRQSMTVDSTVGHLAPGLMIFGAGLGLVMAQISNLTLSAVPLHLAGEASGINNTLRQLGSTLGSAIIGAVMLSALSANLVNGITASSVIPTSMKTAVAQEISQQTSAVEFGGGVQTREGIPPVVTAEIHRISNQSMVDAARVTFVYTALFSFLGFLTAFSLPNIKASSRQGAPTAGH